MGEIIALPANTKWSGNFMPFSGIAKPGDLKILAAIFEEHCALAGISDEEGREAAAARVTNLYMAGTTTLIELRKMLAMMRNDDEARRAPG